MSGIANGWRMGCVYPRFPASIYIARGEYDTGYSMRLYTHAHRLMMGWATELGPRPCQFVALERSRFRKIA